jgi:hypothetical protein
MIKKSTVSKDVGWDKRNTPIPSRQVAEATIGAARRGMYGAIYNLLEWHRFCPSPENDTDRETLSMISKCYEEGTE